MAQPLLRHVDSFLLLVEARGKHANVEEVCKVPVPHRLRRILVIQVFENLRPPERRGELEEGEVPVGALHFVLVLVKLLLDSV